MDIKFIVTIIVSLLGCVGTVIGIYVRMQRSQDLSDQQIRFTNETVSELKKRVSELEKNLADKVDIIHDDIHEIKISLAKLTSNT